MYHHCDPFARPHASSKQIDSCLPRQNLEVMMSQVSDCKNKPSPSVTCICVLECIELPSNLLRQLQRLVIHVNLFEVNQIRVSVCFRNSK
jgi:hypothetical protein